MTRDRRHFPLRSIPVPGAHADWALEYRTAYRAAFMGGRAELAPDVFGDRYRDARLAALRAGGEDGAAARESGATFPAPAAADELAPRRKRKGGTP